MTIKQKMRTFVATHKRLTAVALAIAAFTGCSMMNPYDHVKLAEDTPKPADGESPPGLRLAGYASEGLQAADDMRQTYYNNLRYTSYVRNGTAATASVLSGWAIYNALKPGGSGPDASDGDTRRGVRLGATLATLYGMRQLFVNPDQESIHAEGYRSLTCLMLQSAPLLMTESIPKTPVAASAAAAPVPALADMDFQTLVKTRGMPPAASAAGMESRDPNAGVLLPRYTEGLGDLDRLQLALDRLEQRILILNLQAARDETNLSAIAAGDKAILKSQQHLTDQIKETKTALRYARNTLSDGRALVRTIKTSGRDIKDRVGIIVAIVNEQVQNKQNNFRQASDVLKDAHDITSGILNIGSDTAADQTSLPDPATPVSTLSRDRAILLAGPMTAAAGLLIGPIAGQVTPSRVAAASEPASAASKPLAAAGPAAAASPVASAPKKPTKVTKPVPPASKAEPPTSAELQAIRDKLDGAIKAMAARQAEADKKAANEAHQKELDAQAKTIARLNKLLDEQAFRCSRTLDKGGCATDLAEETERLYAARRPIVQELLNFRRKTRAVLATPECAELAILRVTPNDVMRGYPGDTLSYIVSQRAAGNPTAILEGPINDETGVKFDFLPLQATSPSLFVAKVQIGAKMKPQTIRLVVTDSKGIASQTINIVAGAVQKADPPSSGASAASAPAAAASAASAAAKSAV